MVRDTVGMAGQHLNLLSEFCCCLGLGSKACDLVCLINSHADGDNERGKQGLLHCSHGNSFGAPT